MREDLAVARLVIVGRVRKRNQDPRQTKKRQLSETGSARARDGKIRRAVNFFHAMMKRRDKRRNFFSAVIIGNEALIARAGEMNHLEWPIAQGSERFDHCLIDPARPLTAAHDQQGW